MGNLFVLINNLQLKEKTGELMQTRNALFEIDLQLKAFDVLMKDKDRLRERVNLL